MKPSGRPLIVLAIAILGLLAGSSWLLNSVWPRATPLALAAAIHFALIAGLGWLSMHRTHAPWPARRQATATTLAGLSLFALPMLLVDHVSSSIPELTTAAIFAGVPAITVLWAVILGDTLALPTALAPSLLGWWGALLLFPVALPTSPRQAACFLTVLLAAVSFAGAGIWLHRLLKTVALSTTLTIIGLANAAAFALASTPDRLGSATLAHAAIELPRGLVVDLPIVLLTLWLLRETDALRASSRALLTPVVTIIEGYILMHDRPPLVTITAVAMLLLAVLWLLSASSDSPSPHSLASSDG